jgi:hypothetical protein
MFTRKLHREPYKFSDPDAGADCLRREKEPRDHWRFTLAGVAIFYICAFWLFAVGRGLFMVLLALWRLAFNGLS